MMKNEYHIVHRPVIGGRHKRERDISPGVIKPGAILGDRGREGGSKIQFLRRRRLWMFPYRKSIFDFGAVLATFGQLFRIFLA